MGWKNKVRKALGDWLDARRQTRLQARSEQLAAVNQERRALALESFPYASEAAAEAASFASTLTQSFESLLGRLKPLIENPDKYRTQHGIKGNKPLQIEINQSLDSLKEVAQSSLDASKNLVRLASTEAPELIEAANKAKKAANDAWQAAAEAKAKFNEMLSDSIEGTPEDFIRASENAVAKLKEAEKIAWEVHNDIMKSPHLYAVVGAPALGGADDKQKETSGETTWNTIADTTSVVAETVVEPVLEIAAPVLDTVDAVKIGALNAAGNAVTRGSIVNAGEMVDKAETLAIQKGVIEPLGVVADKGVKPAVVGTVDYVVTPITKIPGQIINPLVNSVSPTPGRITIEDKPTRDLKFPSYSHVPDQKPSIPREGASDEIWAAAAGENRSREAFTEDPSLSVR